MSRLWVVACPCPSLRSFRTVDLSCFRELQRWIQSRRLTSATTPDRLSRSPGINSRSIFFQLPASSITCSPGKGDLLDDRRRFPAVESSDGGVCVFRMSLQMPKMGLAFGAEDP